MYFAALRKVDCTYKRFKQLDTTTQKHFFSQQKTLKQNPEWIAGRFLLAELLAVDVLPEITLSITKNGKPYFTNQRFPFFSISHSKNYICVVVSDQEVGCDIELKRDKQHYQTIAANYFVPEYPDRQRIQNLSIDTFWQIWVQKEAVLKYQGKTVWDMSNVALAHLPSMLKVCTHTINNLVLAVCGESDLPVIWKECDQRNFYMC